MTGLFEWLLKVIVIVALLPCALSLGGVLVTAFLVAVLPWVIGLCVLIGLAAGIGAGLVSRRRLPPQRYEQFPPGEVPRIRRPRGVRTER
jgi:hypothetical protein